MYLFDGHFTTTVTTNLFSDRSIFPTIQLIRIKLSAPTDCNSSAVVEIFFRPFQLITLSQCSCALRSETGSSLVFVSMPREER